MIKRIPCGHISLYLGLSTDTKPVDSGLKENDLNGSVFYEMDTQKVFMYDEEGSEWKAQNSEE